MCDHTDDPPRVNTRSSPQPSLGVSRATSTDVLIQAREGEKTRGRLIEIISKHTPMTAMEVAAAIDRNLYLTPSEALERGLIDSVAMNKPPPPPPPPPTMPLALEDSAVGNGGGGGLKPAGQ
mmetsp:Transcript_3047/g.6582  ORF Transcript_3047/g.6582 Transcript_3047/m.6582 type:complete len:122 (-) Transcript_3047:323-688(-)